jgi:hypothetical protein
MVNSLLEIQDITFSPYSSIDNSINDIFPSFDEESQRRMRKSILNAKKSAIKHRDENTDAAARQKYREFIPATILNKKGYSFVYEKPIQGKTPDWLDLTAKLMVESYTFERLGISTFLDRTTSAITCKCNKYKPIITANSLQFAVALYIDYLSLGMLLEEFLEQPGFFRSVFDTNNSLSAILAFNESRVILGKQPKQLYEFICICVDSSFTAIPNWPFYTIKCT